MHHVQTGPNEPTVSCVRLSLVSCPRSRRLRHSIDINVYQTRLGLRCIQVAAPDVTTRRAGARRIGRCLPRTAVLRYEVPAGGRPSRRSFVDAADRQVPDGILTHHVRDDCPYRRNRQPPMPAQLRVAQPALRRTRPTSESAAEASKPQRPLSHDRVGDRSIAAAADLLVIIPADPVSTWTGKPSGSFFKKPRDFVPAGTR